jgi:hypothetical protein
MKVSLHTGSGETAQVYWLIGDPELPERQHSSAMAVVFSTTRLQQTGISGAGWTQVKNLDRGNDGVTFEGSTLLQFDSELDRAVFMFGLSRQDADKPHALAGDVHLRCNDGDEWQDEVIPDALLTLLEITPVGKVALRVRYRAAGGQTEEGTAGTYSWLLAEDGTHLLTEDGRYLAAEDHEE